MERFALLQDFVDGSGPAGPVLAINPAPSPLLSSLTAPDCIQPDYRLARALRERGHTVVDQPAPPYQTTLVRLGRSREETNGRVALAWSATATGGLIAISGAKTDGIDTLSKSLKGAGVDLDAMPKAHGKLLVIRRTDAAPEILDDWAKAAEPAQNDGGFWTVPGIFSPAKVDGGTALLIETLPADLKGPALDLGAGWGALSAALLEKNPAITELTLIEADQRAIALAERNVLDSRTKFVWGDATDAETVPMGMDVIVMNPPFHEGRKGEPQLGVAFIQSAARALTGRGQLLMVANRHLPYEKTLEDCFGKIERVADNGAFKVIRASRPQTRKGRGRR